MSAYGVFISGPGALLYFGVDAFHPGGWGGFLENYGQISIEGQQINGPGWRIVPFGNK